MIRLTLSLYGAHSVATSFLPDEETSQRDIIPGHRICSLEGSLLVWSFQKGMEEPIRGMVGQDNVFFIFFVRDKRTLLLQARALTRRTEIPRVPNSFTAWTTREEKGAATESPKLFCMLSRVSRSSPMGRKPHGSDVAPSASPHWGHASRYPAMNLVIKQAIFSLRKHLVGPPDRSCLPGVVQRHRY